MGEGREGGRAYGEDEEADGGAEAGEEGGDETVFLGTETVGEDVGDHVEVEVGHVDADADQA